MKKVFHPGVFLSEELEARAVVCKECGTSKPYLQKQFSIDSGLPERTISEIMKAKRRITPTTAAKIAKTLGTSQKLWLRLQTDWDCRDEENPSDLTS